MRAFSSTVVSVLLSCAWPAVTSASSTTVHNDRTSGFPSDQRIRNARVGLWENGWFSEELLFDMPPRDFLLILLAPSGGSRLVQEYQDPDRLRQAIPHGQRLTTLPRTPFIGELSYKDVIETLDTQRRWFTRSERIIVDQVSDYLRLKLTQLRTVNGQG
jgi:hypothetical protein